MISAAYTAARWVEYASAAVAVIASSAIIWRVLIRPRKQILAPACILVVAGAIYAATFAFLGTRVEQIRLDSIQQVGLETHHAGLRTNALMYDTQASVKDTSWELPPGFPASSIINKISGYLVYRTTTVHAQVAVYGLISSATLDAETATVNRQARTIVLPLPDPVISKNTTYIASVNGIQVREGPLNAVAQNLAALINSLLGRPVMSFSAQPALAKTEAAALTKAQHSVVLDSCGKEEIAQQLARIFQLVPEYRDYAVKVIWPSPPASVNCARL